MLALVHEAVRRFRRRLRWAAFVRGTALGFFALAATVSVILLAGRFLPGVGVLGAPAWLVWAGMTVVAVAGGAVLAVRKTIDDCLVVAHIEQRLSTHGLLLAASDGVQLEPAWQRRLQQRLAGLSAVMPSIRWQRLLLRPSAAALVLLVVQCLPPVAADLQAGGAVALAVERLHEQIEQVAELSAASGEQVAELRASVQELLERVAVGEAGLWREIDSLQERVDRERSLASGSGGDATSGGEQQVFEGGASELAGELAKAAAEMVSVGALDQLPAGMQSAIAELGVAALEQIDLQALQALLPQDLEQLRAMAEALAKLAQGMQSGGSEGGKPTAQGAPGKLSPEMAAKMAALAKGLMDKAALAGMGQSSPGSGVDSGSGTGNGMGAGTAPGGLGLAGGGHVALRLTEHAEGGVGTSEVELPAPVSGDLPFEWVPVATEKVSPEVGKVQAVGVGRAGASGSGGATWQLRLMPRHRDVVRRFFAEKNK